MSGDKQADPAPSHGYVHCQCRDCFDVAICSAPLGEEHEWGHHLCWECSEAGCEDDKECSREDLFDDPECMDYDD